MSLADLSQPAGVTAVIAEMETHFCASRLLAERVPSSFCQCAEEQGETPKCGSVREGRSGLINLATPQLMQGVQKRHKLPAFSGCTEV